MAMNYKGVSFQLVQFAHCVNFLAPCMPMVVRKGMFRFVMLGLV